MYKRVNELLGTDYNGDNMIPWLSSSFYLKDLSEEFIEEFKNYVDWGLISSWQVLSEDFIKRYKDKVDWRLISVHQVLSWEFMLEFEPLLSWNSISLGQPFIMNSKHSRIRKYFLDRNVIYHLYQQTKERGWFFGYICSNVVKDPSVKYKDVCLGPINYYQSSDISLKVRIWWKDLVLLNKVKIFEPVRLIKDLRE